MECNNIWNIKCNFSKKIFFKFANVQLETLIESIDSFIQN